MNDTTIVCPHCSSEIKLTESLAGPLLADAKKEFQATLAKMSAETKKRQEELDAKESNILKTVTERINAERASIVREEAQKAKEQVRQEVVATQAVMAEMESKLSEAQKAQAEFLRKERAMEDAKREMALTIEKQVTAGIAAARTATEESVKMKVLERDAKIADLTKHIEELKQKAEQGDQRLQGEVQELHLEGLLKTAFPFDIIEPVGKGEFGGDIVQTVRTSGNKVCGKILWESKRTKHWSDGWLEKLRADQRTAKAEISAIVSQALPESITAFGMVDGVCVCSANEKVFLPVAAMLRDKLIEVDMSSVRHVGQQTKAELLYEYLTGPHFKHRIEAIVEAFSGMQEDLDKEIKAVTRIWDKRRAQINMVMTSVVGLHGDVSGIAGKSLQEVNGLQLEAVR